MLLPVAAALACESDLLGRFHAPAEPPPELTIEHTSAVHDDVRFTGAHVTFRSASPVRAWERVLQHPELQDEWHPKELGTERVDRIEGTNFYQRTRITVLGAITIHRQLIARIQWLEHTAKQIRTCWYAGDPATWPEKIAPLDDGSTWQDHGLGGWDIAELPDGTSRVSYQVWIDSDFLPPALVSWAVSRTLPTLLNAFEQRVADLERAAKTAAAAPATP